MRLTESFKSESAALHRVIELVKEGKAVSITPLKQNGVITFLVTNHK